MRVRICKRRRSARLRLFGANTRRRQVLSCAYDASSIIPALELASRPSKDTPSGRMPPKAQNSCHITLSTLTCPFAFGLRLYRLNWRNELSSTSFLGDQHPPCCANNNVVVSSPTFDSINRPPSSHRSCEA
ncbi:hypothetical protein BDN72DRAFT_105907 [Pluteus cervinus]|uniref:Uncharacterized protein n=1 Tax=Pluteus cervinus TaxID=181527 RepID=A0ACD3ANZ7_9AGAR|nr:hypothetical protein BDN72DRAFT_105907 [Pluteus cervinus]